MGALSLHIVSLFIAFAVIACGGESPAPPAKGSYSLELAGYTAHAGRRMQLKIKRGDSEDVVAHYQGSIRPDGTQVISFDAILDPDVRYRVDYFIDSDNDGDYTRPTGTGFIDPAWRRMITGSLLPFEDFHSHDMNWVDIYPF